MPEATVRVSGLFTYPIKSCQGVALQKAELDKFGIRWDRAWMLTDSEGTFLSQRTHPKMAQIRPAVTEQELIVEAPGMPRLILPHETSEEMVACANVWSDEMMVELVDSAADRWFTEFLGVDCMLARRMEDHDRVVAGTDHAVSFADGYPLLVLSDASVDELNARASEEVPADRFRANILVEGAAAHDEDRWDFVSIAGNNIRMIKPCERCVITLTDQRSGTRAKEPLRTLAGYRRNGSSLPLDERVEKGKVLFAQNAVHFAPYGALRIGDEVKVRSWREVA